MKPSPGGRLPQAMFQSPPVHASTPSKIPLGHFPGLGRGDGRPFRPGWQVHLGQAFSPGQPSTTASWVQAMPGSQISPSLPSSPPTLLLQPPPSSGGMALGFLTPRAVPGHRLLLEDTLAGTQG